MGKDEAGGGSVMLKSFIFNLEAMEAIKRLGKRSREWQSDVCFKINHCDFRMEKQRGAKIEVGRLRMEVIIETSGKMMVTSWSGGSGNGKSR